MSGAADSRIRAGGGVLEVSERLVGQQCRSDGLSSSTRQIAGFQAAKKKGGRNVKSKQVLFYTEAVYKNKEANRKERAPCLRFCSDLLAATPSAILIHAASVML